MTAGWINSDADAKSCSLQRHRILRARSSSEVWEAGGSDRLEDHANMEGGLVEGISGLRKKQSGV